MIQDDLKIIHQGLLLILHTHIIPSGVESTPEKSVASEELCVARGRRTTIEGETNTIYSSLASCGQLIKDQY